ncbi:hypothetical protein J3361_24860 [Pseudomonas sp. OA65]|nr:hypothetical protein [Pseudomonas sp. OA65]MBO1541379.1 hypothetical protein [Pseudomonas sp. OA65]
MKILKLVWGVVGSALLLLCIPMAEAMTQEITAVFRPNPSNPTNNKFINTTPVWGFCREEPGQCANLGLHSHLARINFTSSQPIQPNHTDVRKGAMFSLPSGWRTVRIVDSATGKSEEVSIRIAGVGAVYRLDVNPVELVGEEVDFIEAHRMLWGGHWNSPPQPCRNGLPHSQFYGVNGFGFFWHTPQQDFVCAKGAKYLIPALRYQNFNYTYELRTPDPLKMLSGMYTGSLTYSVGPGQDFDMGDVMHPDDQTLTLNFNLEVDHAFRVEVPPGGNRVELVPQEGWQSWLTTGSKPTRLFRDQTFHISASSYFKMRLECQHISGNTCAIAEAGSGHAVPVDVSVSLPDGLTDATGQPVNRRRLLLDGSGTELFKPSFFVNRQRGLLHFEVGGQSVGEMLDNGAKAYTGNVTVIWDSEV